MSTLKAIKSYFEMSYDKQNITLVVTSYEMATRVISSMCTIHTYFIDNCFFVTALLALVITNQHVKIAAFQP